MNWRPIESGRSSSSDIVSARTFFVLPMGEMFGEDECFPLEDFGMSSGGDRR